MGTRAHRVAITALGLASSIALAIACQNDPYREDPGPSPVLPPRRDAAGPPDPVSVTTTEPPPTETTSTPLPDRLPEAPGEIDLDAGADVVDAGPPPECRDAPKPVPIYQWKTPAPKSTACTSDDIAFFAGQTATPGFTYKSLETGMRGRSVACASCIFSRSEDATWSLIVFLDANGGAFTNWGAAYVHATGGSEQCGREWQRFQSCLTDMCSGCTGDARTQCRTAMAGDKNSCGGLTFPACGDARKAIYEATKTLDRAANVVCGPTPTQ